MSEYKCGKGGCGLCVKGCSRHTDKLNTYDWLADLPDNAQACNIVEVQFKPPRKGYFLNTNGLQLEKGDVVAVEANPGHDIGTVTMTGRLVKLQIKKANLKPDVELKRVYRKARPVDMDKYAEAKAREHDTMIKSRQIAKDLGLKMKIGDVEYQGDCNKAIFYYIADERVDFRQLIKVLAEKFRVRIEMKQIGARQEAGRIGGTGPCGRELCCATWMTSFVSVSTSAARFQDISLNPQKLAGQCAKLKCCLNYEVDQYVESLKCLPSREITLQTADNEYFFFKADILRHMITYSTDKHILANETTISARRAFEVISMNRDGKKPDSLTEEGEDVSVSRHLDLLEQENINRFDKNKKRKKKRQDPAQGKGGQPRKEQEGADQQQAQGRKGDGGVKRGQPRNDGERREGQPQRKAKDQGAQPGGKPSDGGQNGRNARRDDRRQRQRNNNRDRSERLPGGENGAKKGGEA